MKTKFIQTRINEDVFEKLKKKAEDEERSLSSLIRVIVKKYLALIDAKGKGTHET